MKKIVPRSGTLLLALTLGALLGCQGVSVGGGGSSKSSTSQGALPGQLAAAPATVNFGNVPAGTSQTQSETLTNTGLSSVTVTQVTVTGSGFSTSGLTLPLSLAVGQSAGFNVVFQPSSAGNSYSGSVAIASNAANSSLTLSLSGSAMDEAGQLSASAVNVGNVTDGNNGTQTGTLTATGTSVVVSSVSLGGTNPTEFAISGLSFPVTVSTTAPVSFTVTFTPQASGGASASASFASNAANSPAAASLLGTGVAATAHSVNLSWDASSSTDVVSYNIYRASFTSACGAYAKVGSSASTTYIDASVTNGQAYCYEATAVDSSGDESKDSIPIQDVAIPSS